MITPQFLPVPISDAEPADIGVVSQRPIGISINRVMRWWKVNTWKFAGDFKFSTSVEPHLVWQFKREFSFKNHMISGYDQLDQPFEVTASDQLQLPRFTKYKGYFPIGAAEGTNLNPAGWFSIRIFHDQPAVSVKKIGTLYYPFLEIKLGLTTGEVQPIELHYPTVDEDYIPKDTKIFVSFDNLGLPGLTSGPNTDTDVIWGGGTINIEALDYWY